MRTNWFEDFFHGLALEFWRNAITPQETEQDVNFLETELGLVKGSRVLDIPCGNGRHSLEFAKRGYAMSCIDLSDEFIAEARQSANANGVHLDECIRMDIRDINFQERFDGAFCFGNSFGYLDREANAKFLKNMSRSKPDWRQNPCCQDCRLADGIVSVTSSRSVKIVTIPWKASFTPTTRSFVEGPSSAVPRCTPCIRWLN